MFAHPSTSHFSRTYHHTANPIQTTSRKNVNKENAASGLPSKTPSRAGLLGKAPGTSIRVGLGPKGAGGAKDGNVLGQPVEQGGEKGKATDSHDIEPKRLFASTTKQSGSTPAPSRLNRTPGPRRQVQTFSTLRTPAPAPSNSFASPTNHLSELQLSTTRQTLGVGTRGTRPSPGPTPLPSGKARRTSKSAQSSPGPTPLPSATRTRRRSRQSLTPAQPEFQTPAPRWEEEPSLGSITGGVDGLELGALNEVEELDEEMDNELEYMPPPAQELPWEPPFNMPDIAGAFSKLSSLPPLWAPKSERKLEAPPDPRLDFDDEPRVRLCDDEMLEEPEFRRQPLKTLAKAPNGERITAKPVAQSVAFKSATQRPTGPIQRRMIPATAPAFRHKPAVGQRPPPVESTSARRTALPQTTSNIPRQFVARPQRPVAPPALPVFDDLQIPLEPLELDDVQLSLE